MQIAILLVAGIPVVALTQPFIPRVPAMSILLLGLLLLIVPLWRSATNLHGHVRAGAQVLLEALASQSGTPRVGQAADPGARPARDAAGMGNATTIRLAAGSAAIGRTLKQIDLRGLTGATVIAIDREPADVIYPTGDEVLTGGDTLIITGTAQAVQAAQELLAAPAAAIAAADATLRVARRLELGLRHRRDLAAAAAGEIGEHLFAGGLAALDQREADLVALLGRDQAVAA